MTVCVEVELSGNMLEREEAIQAAVCEVGGLLTGETLSDFDADGSPIQIGDLRLTSKGKVHQTYETPFGPVGVDRHLYQTSSGGRTFCPLEENARILLTATPRLAMMVASKYAMFGAPAVRRDLEENHGRTIAISYVKSLADTVGEIVKRKEEIWDYAVPEMPKPVAHVGASVDGTCMLTCDTGWRQAMVGTCSLYDANGERMHTVYIGSTPEYGKETFKSRFEKELEKIRKEFPSAPVVGVADGAPENWTFLEQFTDDQVLDFYHVSEYIGAVAQALYPHRSKTHEREAWLGDQLHELKHQAGGARRLLSKLIHLRKGDLPASARQKITDAIRYVKNNLHRMNYADLIAKHMPIGSGVCEAACKTIIKQRLCGSGMRWRERGASAVIALRTLQETQGRWSGFWKKLASIGK
jgi:quinol monooxygenase YgiN